MQRQPKKAACAQPNKRRATEDTGPAFSFFLVTDWVCYMVSLSRQGGHNNSAELGIENGTRTTVLGFLLL